MSLQIVTCADKHPEADYLKRGFKAFKESCMRYGFDPIILGWGQEWKGLGSKPKLLKRAIEGGTITADRILFVDAFDVVITSDPEASDLFVRTIFPNARIFWNAERACFPNASLASAHPKTPWPWKYLNSGASIGDTAAYLECLTEMEVDAWPDDHQNADQTWTHRNDQDDWMHRFLFGQCGNQCKMELDSQCSIFQTFSDCAPEEFEIASNGMVKNLITGLCPTVLHFNGGSKTAGLMEPILEALEL